VAKGRHPLSQHASMGCMSTGQGDAWQQMLCSAATRLYPRQQENTAAAGYARQLRQACYGKLALLQHVGLLCTRGIPRALGYGGRVACIWLGPCSWRNQGCKGTVAGWPAFG
jgi:hypothetical protein